MTTTSADVVRKLLIAGAGGFGAEAAWVAEEMNAAGSVPWQWRLLGFVDDNPEKVNSAVFDYPVLGLPAPMATRFQGEEIWYHCAIADYEARRQMVERLQQFGWRPASLLHPSAIRARNIDVGAGTYVGALAILSPNCRIGQQVIINQRAAIGHDSVIGDFANICPGAQINGHCTIGPGARIGSNASIHQGRSVGERASVASNSLVIRAVAAGTTVLGIPARSLKVA